MTVVTFIASAICFGMALLFGSTGETIAEKSGHLNLGIPGVMCVGAACGCVAEAVYFDICGSYENMVAPLAIIIPIIATLTGGAIMGAIYSFFTVTLRSNQNVTGLVLTTMGVGISDYLISLVDGQLYKFSNASVFFKGPYYWVQNMIKGFPKKGTTEYEIKMFLQENPFVNGLFKLFGSYGVMVILAIIIAVATSIVLNKTRIGLHLRAVGENPATADAAGINVSRYRYLSTIIGCAIAGLGGLTIVMDYWNGNWEYVIDAVGWLSVALVIFTMWKPLFGIFCSMIFGAFYVASAYIPGIGLEVKELLEMLPYLVTIGVLIFTSIRNKKENQAPAALGTNYFREER